MIVVSHCAHVTLREGAVYSSIVPKVLDTAGCQTIEYQERILILQGGLPPVNWGKLSIARAGLPGGTHIKSYIPKINPGS